MATMNIKDPEVHRLARVLAERRRTSMTGAVREALSEALAREEAGREGVAERLLALGAASRRVSEPVRPAADLYDDDGLPR